MRSREAFCNFAYNHGKINTLTTKMIEISYNVRPFIKPITQQVAVRVRWNRKKNETTFITGVYADPAKWDTDGLKAKKGTTHIVGHRKYSSSEINERISDFKQEIDLVFESFAMKNTVPTVVELKDIVNEGLGRKEIDVVEFKPTKRKSIKELLQDFLQDGEREKNWDDDAKEKYTQAVNHLMKAVPHLRVDSITIEVMYKLRDWYVANNYKNRTVSKQLVMLKAFLRWISEQKGYSIPDKVLNFTPHLKVIRKTVSFLHYDELIHLAEYPLTKAHIRHARDLWCFMAFTSLRYSDLANLKVGHISDNRIDMITQKTSDRIIIPLTDGALKIYDRYKDSPTPDGHIFYVPANQKLNEYIKEAAKEAGLNRVLVDTYFVGTERKEEQHPFHEIISCHDARRTFVSCSLAMGIPPQVVMKATGHKGYKTMQPYIDTAMETQALEMEKWNKTQYRSQIITLLDKMDENELKLILNTIKDPDRLLRVVQSMAN